MRNPTPQELQRRKELLQRHWAKHAPRYDKQMTFWERRIFGTDHRVWCGAVDSTALHVDAALAAQLPQDWRVSWPTKTKPSRQRWSTEDRRNSPIWRRRHKRRPRSSSG